MPIGTANQNPAAVQMISNSPYTGGALGGAALGGYGLGLERVALGGYSLPLGGAAMSSYGLGTSGLGNRMMAPAFAVGVGLGGLGYGLGGLGYARYGY